MIRDIIKNKYDAPYLSWKKIPKPVRDMWFGEFQKEFRWLLEHNTRIITNFERRGATRLRDRFTDIRKSGQRPNWIGEGVWADLSSAWATPEFVKMREQNKQNRASDYGGLGSSLYTGGSVPHMEHRRRLKEHLGREPTPLELHTRTHQHQADQQWVDEKAKKAHDDFVRARDSRQSTGEGSSSGSAHISEYHTWSEVVDGRQKGRVYGLGAQGYAIEGSSSTSAFHDLSGAEESISERVAALTREIEEMRKVQNEMQAELQSYRVQRRQEEEQRRTSQDSLEFRVNLSQIEGRLSFFLQVLQVSGSLPVVWPPETTIPDGLSTTAGNYLKSPVHNRRSSDGTQWLGVGILAVTTAVTSDGHDRQSSPVIIGDLATRYTVRKGEKSKMKEGKEEENTSTNPSNTVLSTTVRPLPILQLPLEFFRPSIDFLQYVIHNQISSSPLTTTDLLPVRQLMSDFCQFIDHCQTSACSLTTTGLLHLRRPLPNFCLFLNHRRCALQCLHFVSIKSYV
ncbi:hypothetical protein KFK09_014970 [Dendrobium nobile]|uniref:Transposase n=1 Tax=Dendrobium nobile TaxID=94219 RepID=A0A8T3B5V9_DENNO|nr:hypothetical protein KFK09_014970 [Dendrobium nobile]